ncbi:MAG: transglutaminase family protein [Pseudomonadota bacterium]
MRFTITHATDYVFSAPVELHPHRIMMRPRDGHHLRIVDALLSISPNASTVWSFDVFGNSIGTLSFAGAADRLAITSTLDIERFAANPEGMLVDGRTARYPLEYSPEERRDLATLLLMDDERGLPALESWIEGHNLRGSDDALSLARALMESIYTGFTYEARYSEGTLLPSQMLEAGSGTCRDYAFFMMEAARVVGFAARFATGYLYSPALDNADGPTTVGAGATHAWAELFIPGVGWIDFDPTNNLTGSADLIKVATVRKPSQAIPVSGSFTGPQGAGGPPQVSVTVARTN